MERKGFAIIGCGAIARLHANAIKKCGCAELIGAFDVSSASAERFCNEFETKKYDTLDDLLNDTGVDAVSICLPSGLHAKYVVMAAEHGKHILVEKPLAITKEQNKEIIEAVKKHGVKLECISQYRFSDSIQKLKKAIDEGRLGKILSADFRMKYYRTPEYYLAGGWRGTFAMDGGGALMNQGIHGVDLINYITGGIRYVTATARTLLHDIEVEDSVNAIVEYNSGAVGVIQATTMTKPGYPRMIEVVGTRGTVIIQEDSILKWDVDGESVEAKESSRVNSFADPMAISDIYHQKQIRDLVSAICNDSKPFIDEYEGKDAVDIVLAIYESSRLEKKIDLHEFAKYC